MQLLGTKIEETQTDWAREQVRTADEVHGHSLPQPKELRVLMVAGGTGGHIFPALAVAEELERRVTRRGDRVCIEFLGTKRGLESRLIPQKGFRLHTVKAAGLKGIGGWRWLSNLLILPRTAIETALVLRRFQPDVVMGIGGYLAGPVMLEATLNNIPTVLLEPNAVPGFTNRVLAPVIQKAAVGFEGAVRFYGAKACLTGHPVRKEFARIPPKAHAPPFTVLIVGGSQGSKAINDCVVRSLPLLEPYRDRLNFIHQTGEEDYNEVNLAYQEHGITAEVRAFIEDMPGEFARADLVVSRAGATAISELAAAGKAALLIPFPAAADQHQLENARVFERAGAARVLEQRELTPERWIHELWNLLEHPDRLVDMERRARSLARLDATERIADLIESVAVRGQ